MQLNKIRKQTFAAFESNDTANSNEFISGFKKYLEETLQVDKVTILGIVSSAHNNQNVMTAYFAYVAPEKKPDKKSKNEKKNKVEKEPGTSGTEKKKKVKSNA